MEADGKRTLKDGKQYDALFPLADYKTTIVKEKAGLEDTMQLIKEVIKKDQYDTAKLAARLKGTTVKDTCRNVWNFVYRHIQYIPDRESVEEIRRPARLWADRATGGDCDCMSVFIATILANLNKGEKNQPFRYVLRIAEYNKGYYQHIYPVVITDDRFYTAKGGRENPEYYIVMDCVKDQFNIEHPYKRIKDYDPSPMNLAYLSGLNDTGDRFDGVAATPDIIDTLHSLGQSDNYYVDGLGRVRRNRRSRTSSAAEAVPVAPAEVKKFYITQTSIYRLENGTVIKPGRPIRSPGEYVMLFRTPGQQDFTESGILNGNTFFVDNNDIAWGIATVNNTYWKKYPQTGWQQTNIFEYAQAQNNKKTPLKLRGYILKDGTRIFLDRRAPKTIYGYPVKWKVADDEGSWNANGTLVSLLVAEDQGFVIGKNGQGNAYKSSGYAQWQQISEEEYSQYRQKALRGFNDLGSLFALNGNDELTLNAPGETRGLYIPYDVLETLFAKRIDPRRNYAGIEGFGYLLGDELLDAIAPLLDGKEDLEGMGETGEEGKSSIFGEVEILGTEGSYDHIGHLAELAHEISGDESLLVADGLGRVRRKRAKRGGAAAASTQAGAGSLKKLGLYVPTNVLAQLLKIRNDNLTRLQNKGIEVSRGTVPPTLQSINGFFDFLKAPLKLVTSVAKFLPIPGVSIAAGLVDKAVDQIPGSNPITRPTGNPYQDLVNRQNQAEQQNQTESANAYDQSVQGFGAFDMIGTLKKYKNPLLIGGGCLLAYGGYKLLTDKKSTVGTLLGIEKRKRKKKKPRKIYRM